jgi:hypothetical protein
VAAGLFFREISKIGPGDEARDAHGRWMRELIDRGNHLHGTGGIVGLSRGQVVEKVRGLLDTVLSHSEGLSRAGTYSGAIATRVVANVIGLPGSEVLSPDLEHHVASATGYIAHKVLAHPAWRRLATAVITRVKKSLDDDEAESLKGIVSGVIADTKLHPRVSCDDAALAEVARGAYQHCHDRLCALKYAAAAA